MMYDLSCDECGKTVAYTDDESVSKKIAGTARLICPPCNQEEDESEEGEDE